MSDPKRQIVLNVDDSEAGRYATSRILQKSGFEVMEAASGEEALKKARQGPDLVLLDVNLPDISGYEVRRRLKADPVTQHLPVLHLSATYLRSEDRIAGLDGGADGFLCQPVDPGELAAEIRSLLRLKQAERQLRDSNALLSATLEATADGILVVDSEGKVQSFNSRFLEMWRIPESLAASRDDEALFRQAHAQLQDSEAFPARVSDLYEASDAIVLDELLLTEGRVFERYTQPMRSGDAVTGRVWSFRDITTRKKAEEEATRRASDWQTTFDTANDAIWVLGPDHSVLRSNKAADRIFGCRPEATAGRRCWEIVHGTSAPIEDCPVVRARESLRRETMELQMGQSWFEVTVDPILDTQGRYSGAVHLVSDITARKRAEEERQRMQDQLVQAQKMDSVGRLAGGVAHDFNNMLGVIIGHTELILGREDLPESLRDDLNEILKAALRSADLTRQLLAFARKQTIAPRALDLNDTVSGMLKMLGRLIGEDIDLAWMPAVGLWPVEIDPAQIDQILANLCINARDAIGGVGKLTIETENVVLDEDYCGRHTGFVSGSFVQLAVSDDGHGMGKEVLDHVFEPFFTTKELGHGTGMGLATVYGIVKQNDGFINIYSEPGKGTTIKVYLPRYEGHPAETVPAIATRIPRGRGETVLLVEDEAAILQMAEKILCRIGYTVLAAPTPAEALRLAEANSGEVHLLITDVVMPGMNGRDLVREIARIRPGAKCLFMSGYTANVIAHQGVLEGGVHFMQKPFTLSDLALKVREALDEGGE